MHVPVPAAHILLPTAWGQQTVRDELAELTSCFLFQFPMMARKHFRFYTERK